MRPGIYRLEYKTTTLEATGVVVFDNGAIHGCDRFHFTSGSYCQKGHRLEGTVALRRHTPRAGISGTIPEQFELRFEGICRDRFGQFDIHCPELPEIHGSATFNWLGGTH